MLKVTGLINKVEIKMKNLNKTVKGIISKYNRVLVGLAHADNGKKVKGCNCCYCTSTEEK